MTIEDRARARVTAPSPARDEARRVAREIAKAWAPDSMEDRATTEIAARIAPILAERDALRERAEKEADNALRWSKARDEACGEVVKLTKERDQADRERQFHLESVGALDEICDARTKQRDAEEAARYREALEDMVYQHCPIVDGRFSDMGLSANENALDALGPDFKPGVDSMCEVPGCGNGWSEGTPETPGSPIGYHRRCSRHPFRARAEQGQGKEEK